MLKAKCVSPEIFRFLFPQHAISSGNLPLRPQEETWSKRAANDSFSGAESTSVSCSADLNWPPDLICTSLTNTELVWRDGQDERHTHGLVLQDMFDKVKATPQRNTYLPSWYMEEVKCFWVAENRWSKTH